MRVALVLVLMFALAGCTSPDDPVPAADDPPAESADASSNTTTTTAQAASEPEQEPEPVGDEEQNETEPAAPPVLRANLSADATSGTAPVAITFQIEGENGTSWSLNVGEGDDHTGDTFPASLEYTYETSGTFLANLTVYGDGNETSQVLEITIVEAPFEPWSQTLTQNLYCAECTEFTTPDSCLTLITGVNELDCVLFELPEDAAGRTFRLTSSIGDPDMIFAESCDLDSARGGTFAAAGEETGAVPDGFGCVVAWEWFDFLSDLTLEVF